MSLYDSLMEMVITEDNILDYQERRSLEEGFYDTKYDISKITKEDIKDKQKLKRIISKLQQEDDQKVKNQIIYYFIITIISILLSVEFSPALAIGAFIGIIANINYTDITGTSWKRIIQRLEKKKESTTDSEELKKIDKMIEVIENKKE